MKLGNKKQWKVFTASVKYLFLVGYIVFSKHCAEPTRFEKASFSHSSSCCSQETPSKRRESISPARLTYLGSTLLVYLQLITPMAATSARGLT